ncbi:hypothetical protein WKI13_20820 [Teredinibacter turnerae]|uniref:hypothetical protein n=1 Tax=Teredinibacter turnerae TaxID=2426 RepID=UPI00039DD56A|nr:hypothetical protein [Teredinibacter turnerae]
MNRPLLPVVAALSLTILSACGGSSDSNDTDSPSNPTPSPSPTATPTPSPTPTPMPSTQTGVFLDSAVSNISYSTETHAGVTNAQGEYQYEQGETVTFAMGAVTLPSVVAGPVITPLTLAGTNDTLDPVVVNIVRFLQTLDTDGDADNGITLSPDVAGFSSALNFDQPVADFESDGVVLAAINAGGQDMVPTGLVAADVAVSHLESTLNTLADDAHIVGVWRQTARPEVHIGESDDALVTFLSNGKYYFIEVNEINEGDDWEYGTYTYASGDLGFDAALDYNDNIGPGDAQLQIQLTADEFRFATQDADESGDYVFSRVAIDGSGIAGAWTVVGEEESRVMVVFANDGTYFGVQPYEEDDDTGFEWGTYTFSEGVANVSINKDIGGSLLADESNDATFTAIVDGDTMTVDFYGDTVVLNRL